MYLHEDPWLKACPDLESDFWSERPSKIFQDMGGSINGGRTIYSGKSHLKWMRTGGTPITLGTSISRYSESNRRSVSILLVGL